VRVLTKFGVFHSTILYHVYDVYIQLNEDCKSVAYLESFPLLIFFLQVCILFTLNHFEKLIYITTIYAYGGLKIDTV